MVINHLLNGMILQLGFYWGCLTSHVFPPGLKQPTPKKKKKKKKTQKLDLDVEEVYQRS